MFKGSIVALVTPMHENGSLDKKALVDLIEWHLAAGTDGIVVAGTTGEFATLDHEEHYELISFVANEVNKRVPVIAGTGTNSTKTTVKLSQQAMKAGADGCLIVTPYYNKPTQQGLYEHYKTVAEHTSLPIILYNVPNRTACDILPTTIEKLSKISNIIGIKEATGKLDRAEEIIARCGKDFAVYSGDDATALQLLLHGAKGVISVTANVAPKKMHDLCHAIIESNAELARKINEELMLLHTRLFLESNPIPTKWVLHQMGKISSGIRMPLLPLDSRYYLQLKEAMQNAGVE